jgi:hypothetical protein
MAIRTWADDEQERLSQLHQDWDMWFVSRFPHKGVTWHARPRGAPVATVEADTPDELDAAIDAAEEEEEEIRES